MLDCEATERLDAVLAIGLENRDLRVIGGLVVELAACAAAHSERSRYCSDLTERINDHAAELARLIDDRTEANRIEARALLRVLGEDRDHANAAILARVGRPHPN